MRVRARLVVAALSAALTACLGLALPADAATLPSPVSCAGCWKPDLNTSWQWQLSSVPSAPYLDVTMYDIDGFDATAADVSNLHSTKSGRKVVCYISAGTYENWRPDAGDFPSSVLGKNVFNVEYTLSTSKFCSKADAQNFNSLKKNLNLDAYRVPCRGV